VFTDKYEVVNKEESKPFNQELALDLDKLSKRYSQPATENGGADMILKKTSLTRSSNDPSQSSDNRNSQYRYLFQLQQKGLQLLKERKTRKQPTEESSDDSDSETVNSQYVLRLNNRINRNLKNSIKIQTRILTLV